MKLYNNEAIIAIQSNTIKQIEYAKTAMHCEMYFADEADQGWSHRPYIILENDEGWIEVHFMNEGTELRLAANDDGGISENLLRKFLIYFAQWKAQNKE